MRSIRGFEGAPLFGGGERWGVVFGKGVGATRDRVRGYGGMVGRAGIDRKEARIGAAQRLGIWCNHVR